MRVILPLTLLVVSACSPAAPSPAASTQAVAFKGAVYEFTKDQALAQLARAVPQLATAAVTHSSSDDGLHCDQRKVGDDIWTICGDASGRVHDVGVYVPGNGQDDAKRSAGPNTEAFMNLLDGEPYTAADRARIHREVREALFSEGGMVERHDKEPAYVAMGVRWVAVEPTGHSYGMSAVADAEPGQRT